MVVIENEEGWKGEGRDMSDCQLLGPGPEISRQGPRIYEKLL